jgi:hypothetical protein
MATLTVKDHTAIITFCLANQAKLKSRRRRSAFDILQSGAKLAKGDRRVRSKLLNAAKEIKGPDAPPLLTHPMWREGLPVLARFSKLKGTVAAKEKFLRKEAGKAKGPLKITLKIAADILADGANTIYDPGHWVVAQWVDPRQFGGTLAAGLQKIKDKVNDVVDNDVTGAISGGIDGAIDGALSGGGLKGIASGAAKGAVKGAIKGSATGSAS